MKNNRNRTLDISTAPTKAKSQEPAYSQALVQNKIVRQRVRSKESGRQADSQTAMVDGVWSLDGEGCTRKTMDQDKIWPLCLLHCLSPDSLLDRARPC